EKLDARRQAARRSATDDEAPQVREDEQPHQQGDRAHAGSLVFVAWPRPRPSAIPALATAAVTARGSVMSLGPREALVTRQWAPASSRYTSSALPRGLSSRAASRRTRSTVSCGAAGSTTTSTEAMGAWPWTRVE